MDDPDIRRAEAIRGLNDALRRFGLGGRIVVTAGLAALGADTVDQVFRAIEGFAEFSGESDPDGEHEFAMLRVGKLKVIWKIDYYDRQSKFQSPDPSDPAVTVRVMTVMLAEEY